MGELFMKEIHIVPDHFINAGTHCIEHLDACCIAAFALLDRCAGTGIIDGSAEKEAVVGRCTNTIVALNNWRNEIKRHLNECTDTSCTFLLEDVYKECERAIKTCEHMLTECKAEKRSWIESAQNAINQWQDCMQRCLECIPESDDEHNPHKRFKIRRYP